MDAHISLVEGGVTKDGTVRLNPLVKCLYCDKRFCFVVYSSPIQKLTNNF